MQSQAGPNGTTALADLANQSQSGVLSFSTAQSSSSAIATDTATATASSNLTHISLLGVIDIAGVQSTATATSDGNNSSGSATTHVGAITVLGMPVSIGSDGVVTPNLPNQLSGILGAVGSNPIGELIDALGIKITQPAATQTQNGASDTVTSGGLQISISPLPQLVSLLEQFGTLIAPAFPPQAAIIPTLPGLLQGATLTLTLGRATASASASPPFDDSFNPPPGGSGDTGSTAGTPGSPGIPGTPGTPGTFTPSASAISPSGTGTGAPGTSTSLASTPSSTSPSSSSSSSLPAALVNLSTPLAAGVIVGGLALTALVGYGLWRLARMLLAEDTGPVCPLGQDVT
jgi:hypothetical protein